MTSNETSTKELTGDKVKNARERGKPRNRNTGRAESRDFLMFFQQCCGGYNADKHEEVHPR
jgi:hypothetical protein